MLQYKRILWIALAIVFLCVLFLLKNGSILQNFFSVNKKQSSELTYDSATLSDLVSRDTDGDTIPDWEEKLYGTDPNKKETTPGVPDAVAIEKLRPQAGQSVSVNSGTENLTQTDKLSRDIFSSVAATSQDGQTIDQSTIDQMGSSLAENIQSSAPRKVFTAADLTTTTDDKKSLQKYSDAGSNLLYDKNASNYSVIDVLQKFLGDGTNVDSSALLELNPIIAKTNNVIKGLAAMSVPKSLVVLHLNILNAFEALSENLSDIQLYDTDAVVAFKGINQYQTSVANLTSSITDINTVLTQKLKN